MKKYLILVLCFITFNRLYAQSNFGLNLGLKNYYAHQNLSGRYNGVDISLGINNSTLNVPLGAFYELSIPSKPYFSLLTSINTNNQNFFVTPRDYDPPQNSPVFPYGHTFISDYRAFQFDIIPSLVIKRNIEYRIGIGYSLNYFLHTNSSGLLPYDAGDRWLSDPNNQKVLQFANEIVKRNPLKKFTSHVVFQAELRYWHLGLEAKYLASLESIYEPVYFQNEFIYPFRGYSSELTLSLKWYIRRIKSVESEF